MSGANEYLGAEDCLTLNVWTPADRQPGERLPVMVFLHGGGNFTGSSIEGLDSVLSLGPDAGPIYDGADLTAAGRVVVVVPNYRLGALGFLAHTVVGLSGTGNFGFLDQQLALTWVKRNAGAFGGDPSKVLLFGQSGGAYDVCMHLTSPASQGLFSRAAMHSGVCYAHPLPVMEGHTRRFLADMQCDGKTDVLGCLRAIPDPEVMVKAPSATPTGLGSFTLHPYVDGQVIPETPFLRLQAGRHARVPFLIGSNSEEYAFRFTTATDATYVRVLAAATGIDAGTPLMNRVLQLYPRSAYRTAQALVVDAVSDKNITCTSRAIARIAAAAQAEPVFRYHFRKTLSAPARLADGAYHTSELLYLFQHMAGRAFPADESDRKVQDSMRAPWTRFADTGAPGSAGGLEWPAFEPTGGEAFMVIAAPTAVETDLKRAVCDFWDNPTP